MDLATGVAAIGFWLFLAAVVVAGIWFDARKRETQQETLRRVVESGQSVDAELIDRMLRSTSENEHPDRDYKIGGIITLSVAPGLVILGYFLNKLEDGLFGVLLGVGLLVGLVGIGLLTAGKMVERWNRDDQQGQKNRSF